MTPIITQVTPISKNQIRISWEFPITTERFQDFYFVLERSESPADGFIPIKEFNHANNYVDVLVYAKIWRSLYYRIKGVNTSTGEETLSKASKLTVPPDLEALEIVRRNNLLLENRRHGTGSLAAVFKLKTIGPKCEECWDPIKQKIRSSSCSNCFLTGIDEGYYAPILAWMNLNPPQKTIQIPQWGEMEGYELRAFMSNEPELNPKDLVFVQNRHMFYRIESVHTTTRRDFLLHQVFAASGIERSNIVYTLLSRYSSLQDDMVYIRDKHIRTS